MIAAEGFKLTRMIFLSQLAFFHLGCTLVSSSNNDENSKAPAELSTELSTLNLTAKSIEPGVSTLVNLSLKDQYGKSFYTQAPAPKLNLSASGGTSQGTFGVSTDNLDGSSSTPFFGVSAGSVLTIQAEVNGKLLKATGTVQVVPAPLPQLSLGHATITPVDGTSTSVMSFTLALNKADSQNVTVNYATSNVTASAGVHYVSASGTATIPAGSTSATISITANNDEVICEAAKTFNVTLSGPSSNSILSSSYIGTGTVNGLRTRQGTITASETWTCDVTVNGNLTLGSNSTVTVSPGKTVTLGSNVIVTVGNAVNDQSQIIFNGNIGSHVTVLSSSSTNPGKFNSNFYVKGIKAYYTDFSYVGSASVKAFDFYLNSTGDFVFQNSTFQYCGLMNLTSYAAATNINIDGNDFRNSADTSRSDAIYLDGTGSNSTTIINNNTSDSRFDFNITNPTITNNSIVVTSNSIGAIDIFANGAVVSGNYVRMVNMTTTHAIQINARAYVHDNYFKGGTWVGLSNSGSGGTISANVFQATGDFTDGGNTHENLYGAPTNALVKNNIFNGSIKYAAFMTTGTGMTGIVFRNNTIHAAAATHLIHLNHYATNSTASIRSNILYNSAAIATYSAIYDEADLNDSFTYLDYNDFYGFTAPNYDITVHSATKTIRTSNGYGMHDLNALSGVLNQKTDPLFTNSSVTMTYADSEFLARTKTAADALAQIRAGYTLQAGSPCRNTGDPQDNGDSDVIDGNRDIGALER